jgi:hypothetical protein
VFGGSSIEKVATSEERKRRKGRRKWFRFPSDDKEFGIRKAVHVELQVDTE